MYRHLVTVEVGVVGRTDQRVQLNRLTFNQNRFERLNTQTVQSRCAVQQNRVLANHFVQNVPHHGLFTLYHFLGGFDGRGQAAQLQLAEDERLEQLQGHLLGKTTLVQFQGRAHNDHRTTGVVHTLTEQVLTEPALLTLDHVGQGFQRALVGAGDGAAATTVIQQGIHGFLEHALFVAHDDVRRVEIQQPLEAIVAIDHATIQIVQIRGGKPAAIQRNQRTKIRRQYRQHFHHHPLRFVTGMNESFQQLQTLGELLDLGFAVGVRNLLTQTINFRFQIDVFHQDLDGFRPHLRFELVTKLFHRLEVLLIGEQLATLERGHTWVGDHVGFKVQHPLDIAQGHVQQQADAAGQRLQEPDVSNRARQLNVAHTLATHLGQRDFNATLFTDDAAVLHALVLAAQTLVVFHRAKDLGTEQTFTLRLEGTVVDGFGLFNFPERPGSNHFRRSQADPNGVKFFDLSLGLEQIQ